MSNRNDRLFWLRWVLHRSSRAGLLEQGVTVDQLRGMWQLRQCEGAPAALLADVAERIDRIAELEKLPLDSHTA